MATEATKSFDVNEAHCFLKDVSVLKNQSITLEDGSRASAIWGLDDFKKSYYPDAITTYENFQRGLKVSNNGNCMAMRSGPNEEFEWITYQTVYDMAHNFGSGLLNLGLESGQKTFIGIYSTNRLEWSVVDLTCGMFSMVSVPLYDTLNPVGCAYMLNLTEVETLVCDGESRINNVLSQHKQIPTLKRIISLTMNLSTDLMEMAKSCHVDILSFSEVIESGKAKPHEIKPCQPDDLYTICSTSGTTGVPKGVMVTHRSLAAVLSTVLTHIEDHIAVTQEDRHLSYLPLGHIYERVIHQITFMNGAKLGYSRGDVKLLMDDMQVFKPTFFFTVPRLLNKIYDKVLLGVNASKLKKLLFNMALRAKSKELKKGVVRNHSFWDKMVFKKVAQAFGGCVKFILITSAPISADVLSFIRCAIGCPVMEAYGSSETGGGATCTLLGDFNTGHVGAPVAGYRMKLVDVPEKNYQADNNQGEICVMGDCLSHGYYKNPEKTAELIDSDGWSHTGDIGEWLPNGTLKIIGRKKDIFKLSQGEYIAVEKIENVYLQCPVILQIFVTGDSLQNFPVAVVVPDYDRLLSWTTSMGLQGTNDELLENVTVKQYILGCMKKEGIRQNLCSFEQVQRVHLYPKPFTIEGGLLTPTLKNRRISLQDLFQKEVTQMYLS